MLFASSMLIADFQGAADQANFEGLISISDLNKRLEHLKS